MEGENLLPVAMAKHIISIKNICLGLLRCPEAQCSARSMGLKKNKNERKLMKTLQCESGEQHHLN